MLLAHQRITESTIDAMMSWRYASGFSVHSQTRLSGCDCEGKEQLARYIARNPVSQERMSISADGMVHYSLGKCRYPGDKTYEILHPLEFLARACLHVPAAYEPMSFMVGRYANRTRGLARKRKSTGGKEHPGNSSSSFTPTSDHEPDTPYRKACRKRWAQLIKKVWLDDPLVCRKCGGSMRVISFITDWPLINKILNHLGLSTPEPPEPVAHSPPTDAFTNIP